MIPNSICKSKCLSLNKKIVFPNCQQKKKKKSNFFIINFSEEMRDTYGCYVYVCGTMERGSHSPIRPVHVGWCYLHAIINEEVNEEEDWVSDRKERKKKQKKIRFLKIRIMVGHTKVYCNIIAIYTNETKLFLIFFSFFFWFVSRKMCLNSFDFNRETKEKK